ncbi:MAG: hypothetical protein MI784_03290, partial [Cytophagales bacterium]|nr:hypothetical protein [Cytophagales bacterium]
MISEFLQGILEVLAYFGASFVLVVVGKVAYQLFHPGINVKHELVEKDNFSFSLAHTGYLVGLLLSIASVMMGESNGLQSDLLDIGFYGLLGILLLNVAVLVNDKLILSKFDIKKEIRVIPNFIDLDKFRKMKKDHFKKAICPNGEKLVIHTSNFRKVKR